MENNDKYQLGAQFSISESVVSFVMEAEQEIIKKLDRYDKVCTYNQAKVLNAFRIQKISQAHFNPTTGYGYSDMGREKLCEIFAQVFCADAALVSPHLLSGTHAIFLALSSILNPGETLLSVCGKPYDTLATAIGITKKHKNSLIEKGVCFEQIDLDESGNVDFSALEKQLIKKPKVVYIQRSRGYTYRKSLNIDTIEKITMLTKQFSKDCFVVCDNCYGEFCETKEPLQVGVDIIIGSLIKNPGGGIAPNGGYIAGRKEIIEEIEYNFTAPGIGHEVGSYNASYMPFYQGLFLAPKVVCESIKGAVLTSYVMSKLGYDVLPKYDDSRSDITQSIVFNTKDELINFIQGIQMGSPVESYALPIPWDMPGYENDVIMAAGTFIQGSSIELSADAPIKEPYIAYIQGGLTKEYHMFGLMFAIDRMKIL